MADANLWAADDEWASVEDLEPDALVAWARWMRDDVRAQTAAWLVASAAVLGPANSWVKWPGIADWFLDIRQEALVVGGWAAATLLQLGWATGLLQLVFTFEQKAMLFPPWSLLVFVKFRQPQVGSVIFFDGCDGRSYVRRVKAVMPSPGAVCAAGPSQVQTVGDMPGAPDDRPLYSADGSATWLDMRLVRGILAAGPFQFRFLLCCLIAVCVLSPSSAMAFAVTSQPLMAVWVSFVLRLFLILIAHSLV
mmetsp:Transcript_92972/g.207692  ORF Transcript_92972/g.207692 Transcript_92972/m.207692 type:complete len:250 (-) Transcript_92972:123-872(-)